MGPLASSCPRRRRRRWWTRYTTSKQSSSRLISKKTNLKTLYITYPVHQKYNSSFYDKQRITYSIHSLSWTCYYLELYTINMPNARNVYNIKCGHAQQAKTIESQEHKKRLTQLVDSIKYAELIKIPLYKYQNTCK